MSDLLKKRLRWLFFGVMTFTLFFSIFGDRGLFKIYKLNKEIKRLNSVSGHLEMHNKKLGDNIRKMKHEKTFQERSAREALGMAQEDEIIYEFSD